MGMLHIISQSPPHWWLGSLDKRNKSNADLSHGILSRFRILVVHRSPVIDWLVDLFITYVEPKAMRSLVILVGWHLDMGRLKRWFSLKVCNNPKVLPTEIGTWVSLAIAYSSISQWFSIVKINHLYMTLEYAWFLEAGCKMVGFEYAPAGLTTQASCPEISALYSPRLSLTPQNHPAMVIKKIVQRDRFPIFTDCLRLPGIYLFKLLHVITWVVSRTGTRMTAFLYFRRFLEPGQV